MNKEDFISEFLILYHEYIHYIWGDQKDSSHGKGLTEFELNKFLEWINKK